mmetsp:Transcript_10210/g.34037  ORF Transcript_10210/g.34037 Transcript_10210/m.34037 type:complete len:204 (-) Transcript_10210:424-1035(-)
MAAEQNTEGEDDGFIDSFDILALQDNRVILAAIVPFASYYPIPQPDHNVIPAVEDLGQARVLHLQPFPPQDRVPDEGALACLGLPEERQHVQWSLLARQPVRYLRRDLQSLSAVVGDEGHRARWPVPDHVVLAQVRYCAAAMVRVRRTRRDVLDVIKQILHGRDLLEETHLVPQGAPAAGYSLARVYRFRRGVRLRARARSQN